MADSARRLEGRTRGDGELRSRLRRGESNPPDPLRLCNPARQVDRRRSGTQERAGLDQAAHAARGKGVGALRRLIAVALLGLGCASPGMPPGGPPDVAAPQLIAITPDSGALGAHPKELLFRFDEV